MLQRWCHVSSHESRKSLNFLVGKRMSIKRKLRELCLKRKLPVPHGWKCKLRLHVLHHLHLLKDSSAHVELLHGHVTKIIRWCSCCTAHANSKAWGHVSGHVSGHGDQVSL